MLPRLHRVRGLALEQTAAHEAVQEAAAHGGRYRGDGLCLDPGGRAEHDVPGGRGREHAIKYHTVKVQMGIERGAEA